MAETDAIFEALVQNPELMIESIETEDFFVSYTARESLDAMGEEKRTTTGYGMSLLKQEGFDGTSVPSEVHEALAFSYRAHCELRQGNAAASDEFCQILESTRLLELAPTRTPRYSALGTEDEGDYIAGADTGDVVEEMLRWGGLELTEPAQEID